MGKPSINSRKSSLIRKKKRKACFTKQIKNKEKEFNDLQAQMYDFKKNLEEAGGSVINEINKCSRENENLAKWLNIYDEQINNYEKEIYNLNLKLYFSSPSSLSQQLQPQHQSCQHQHQLQPQLHPQPCQHQRVQPQSQPPQFKTLADYFRSQQE